MAKYLMIIKGGAFPIGNRECLVLCVCNTIEEAYEGTKAYAKANFKDWNHIGHIFHKPNNPVFITDRIETISNERYVGKKMNPFVTYNFKYIDNGNNN